MIVQMILYLKRDIFKTLLKDIPKISSRLSGHLKIIFYKTFFGTCTVFFYIINCNKININKIHDYFEYIIIYKNIYCQSLPVNLTLGYFTYYSVFQRHN